MTRSKVSAAAWILAAGLLPGASGGTIRPDINPALRYYQAFMTAPDMKQADRDYLFTNEWRGRELDARCRDLLAGFNSEFVLAKAAIGATAPCDWGIELRERGPYTLLPHLGRAKTVAQAARLKVMLALREGREKDAKDDLLTALTLARRVSGDNTLISLLVQIAMENIVNVSVAENYFRISPGTMKELEAGYDAAPPRRLVADSAAGEKAIGCDWLDGELHEIQARHRGEDQRACQEILRMFDSITASEGTNPPVKWPASLKTSDDFIRLQREAQAYYERWAAIMSEPYPGYQAKIEQLSAEVQNSENTIVRLFMPALEKARNREFAIQAKLAMVRAAMEYKIGGEEAFKKVADPFGNGPFAMRPFVMDGEARGFELWSEFAGNGFPETMIFIEKDGAPFYIDGKNAGKPLSTPAAK
jgi:hypothetical protein